MWADGIQRMVYLLQELQENGAINHPIRGQAPIPRGVNVFYL